MNAPKTKRFEALRTSLHLSPLSLLSLSLSLSPTSMVNTFSEGKVRKYTWKHTTAETAKFPHRISLKSLFLSLSSLFSFYLRLRIFFPLKIEMRLHKHSTICDLKTNSMPHGTPDFISIGFRGLRFHFKSCSRLKGGETYHDKHKHKQTFRFDSQFIRLVSIFFLCRNGLSLSRRGGSRKPKKNLCVSFKKEMRSSSSYMARRPLGTCGFKAGYNLTQ